jgi:hypothetical protein
MYALDKPDYEADHPGVSVLFLTTHELGGVCLQVHAAWNVFFSLFLFSRRVALQFFCTCKPGKGCG